MTDQNDDTRSSQLKVTSQEHDRPAVSSESLASLDDSERRDNVYTPYASSFIENDPYGYHSQARQSYHGRMEDLPDSRGGDFSAPYEYDPTYEVEQPLSWVYQSNDYQSRRIHQCVPRVAENDEIQLHRPEQGPSRISSSPRGSHQRRCGQSTAEPGEDARGRQMLNIDYSKRRVNVPSIPVYECGSPTRQIGEAFDAEYDPEPSNTHALYNQNLSADKLKNLSQGRKFVELVDHSGVPIVDRVYDRLQNPRPPQTATSINTSRREIFAIDTSGAERTSRSQRDHGEDTLPNRARLVSRTDSPIILSSPHQRFSHANNFRRSQDLEDGKVSCKVKAWASYLPDNPAHRIHAVQKGKAAIMKRRLPIDKNGKVPKRTYGINDPENIRIVNLYENDHLGFTDITRILNNQRAREGRNPTLSVCGVHARYNRTAPLLFASERKDFIPLRERRKQLKGGVRIPSIEEDTTQADAAMFWTPERDTRLVEIVRQVEGEKWKNVAYLMSQETETEVSVKQVINRWKII